MTQRVRWYWFARVVLRHARVHQRPGLTRAYEAVEDSVCSPIATAVWRWRNRELWRSVQLLMRGCIEA